MADVVCPKCGKVRVYKLGTLRDMLKKGENFTGYCKPCFGTSKDGEITRKHWIRTGSPPSFQNGYVSLCIGRVAPEDAQLFKAMASSNGRVAEHRFVMARILNRPLFSYELVDHRDGNRDNNHPDNLRIYIKGKQEEGSCPGYGTYYHEWQMAEARVRELERLLTSVETPVSLDPSSDATGAAAASSG